MRLENAEGKDAGARFFFFLARKMDHANTLQGGPTCLGDAFE